MKSNWSYREKERVKKKLNQIENRSKIKIRSICCLCFCEGCCLNVNVIYVKDVEQQTRAGYSSVSVVSSSWNSSYVCWFTAAPTTKTKTSTQIIVLAVAIWSWPISAFSKKIDTGNYFHQSAAKLRGTIEYWNAQSSQRNSRSSQVFIFWIDQKLG